MLKEGLMFAERYQLQKLLGRGGFSEVWLALDCETKVQVAVKVYASDSGLDEEGLEIFRQEFAMVFDLNHTNLLRPTYFGTWQKRPFLIMPLCKNGSAYKFLKDDVRITEKECWELLRDVASGLAYMHSKTPPLIHQDIKPDNILISDEGRYMITDFGISSKVRSTFRTIKDVDETLSAGTVSYMGPERFSAKPRPIMASDVWSLGAMMFELMTGGNMPFGNFGGVLQKKGADVPIIEEDYSDELKELIYSCLNLEPWQRPTAADIAERADDHLHGRKTVVQTPETLQEADAVASRDDRATSVLTGEARQSLFEQAEQQAAGTPAGQPEPQKSVPLQQGNDWMKKMLIPLVCVLLVVAGGLAYLLLSGGSSKADEPVAVQEAVADTASATVADTTSMVNTVPQDTVTEAIATQNAQEGTAEESKTEPQPEKDKSTTTKNKTTTETTQTANEQKGPGFSVGTPQPYTGPTVVTVTSNINKAMVVIDGVVRGWAPWSGQLPQGNHTFAVKAKNKDKYTVDGGTRVVSGRSTAIAVNVADPSPFN